MFKHICFICLAVCMFFSMAACGKEETKKETTITGMVVSVDGNVVTLMENSSFGKGERPEGMEDFTMPQDFDRENFRPENFEGTMPEGFDRENFKPEGFDPENFEGTMPEDFDFENMPPMGQRPEGEGFGFQGETRTVDLAKAHISVEDDGIKAAGSMSDITEGCMLTITLNAKGVATEVLVSSGFGGFGGMGNRGDFGNFPGGMGGFSGNFDGRPNEET